MMDNYIKEWMDMWKTIDEFPNYEVNEVGEVRNKNRGTLLKTQLDICGYNVLQLYKGKGKRFYRRVHRLVAEAFISNGDNKPEVNHINGIKTDNNRTNLEWVSMEENLIHAKENKLLSKASKVVVQYSIEGEYIQEFESATLASKYIGCHVSSITGCAGGYTDTAIGYVWRYKNVN